MVLEFGPPPNSVREFEACLVLPTGIEPSWFQSISGISSQLSSRDGYQRSVRTMLIPQSIMSQAVQKNTCVSA